MVASGDVKMIKSVVLALSNDNFRVIAAMPQVQHVDKCASHHVVRKVPAAMVRVLVKDKIVGACPTSARG